MSLLNYAFVASMSLFVGSIFPVNPDFLQLGDYGVVIHSQDDERFALNSPMVQRSQAIMCLIKDSGVHTGIPLRNLTGAELENILMLIRTGDIAEDLTVDQLVSLLNGLNYLDIEGDMKLKKSRSCHKLDDKSMT